MAHQNIPNGTNMHPQNRLFLGRPSRYWRDRRKPITQCACHSLCSRARPELGPDTRDMMSGRVVADVQVLRDFVGGEPDNQECEHLPFPRC